MGTFKFKRGTQAEHDNYIGDEGELTVVSDDNYRPVVHDGVTSGGYPLAFVGESPGGVPDENDLFARYDATALSLSDGSSVSTWQDETGNGHDLTAGTAPTYTTSGINGNPSVSFDGTNQFLETAFSTISQPNQIFIVFQFESTNGDFIYDGDNTTTDRNIFGTQADLSGYRMFGGNFIDGGTPDTIPHVANSLFNGTSSKTELDGTAVLSGDAGTEGLNGLRLGGSAGGTFANVEVGEMLIYPQDKTSVESDVVAYLQNKWGL